jgi:hypothetical protein
MKKIYQFEIRCGKYEGRVTKGEFTSETTVNPAYGNYFYEPTTIIKLGPPIIIETESYKVKNNDTI